MTYRVLARKYRPNTFSDVVGQDHVTRTLIQSLKNDRLGQAYIFSGPRGIGKTTTARLLAMSVNCRNRSSDDVEPCNECESCQQIRESRDVDVLEIDGASNNSVDQIRDLRENARYAPAQNEKKIYIIDEVHMLSRAAFNALLKILEEPPEHIIFIFATTEIEKVPDTILSRCQRFDFRLIPTQDIADALREICKSESIDVDDKALYLIAKFAEGSLRDAQSILDQMINFSGAGDERITEELVSDTWGIAPYDQILELISSIQEMDTEAVLSLLRDHIDDGKDLMALMSDLGEMFRNCLLIKEEKNSGYLNDALPPDVRSRAENLAEEFTRNELIWLFEELLSLHEDLRQHSRFQRELSEVGLIRLTRGRPRYSLGEIVDRLEAIESSDSSASKSQSNVQDRVPKPDSEQSTDVGPSSEQEEFRTETETSANGRESVNTEDSPDNSTTELNWADTIDEIPNPAQAFLRDANDVTLNNGIVKILFTEKYESHVEQLNSERYLDQITDALEKVHSESFDLTIELTSVDDTESSDEDSSTEENDSQSNGNQLIEDAKELFDVEETEKID